MSLCVITLIEQVCPNRLMVTVTDLASAPPAESRRAAAARPKIFIMVGPEFQYSARGKPRPNSVAERKQACKPNAKRQREHPRRRLADRSADWLRSNRVGALVHEGRFLTVGCA